MGSLGACGGDPGRRAVRWAIARGAVLGLGAWVALLESRGMGNIWWRRKSSGRKGFSLKGLCAFAVAPMTRPRLLWHPTMWRHNILVMVLLGAACGGCTAAFGGRPPRSNVAVGGEILPPPAQLAALELESVVAA
jgi:hypothetical protein